MVVASAIYIHSSVQWKRCLINESSSAPTYSMLDIAAAEQFDTGVARRVLHYRPDLIGEYVSLNRRYELIRLLDFRMMY